jgi:hypothetical protein
MPVAGDDQVSATAHALVPPPMLTLALPLVEPGMPPPPKLKI